MKNSLPEELVKGIHDFNQGQFFQCHETLEKLWKNQSGTERNLTQGLIQIAVAYYHLLNGNQAGANKLLKSGMKYLNKLPTKSCPINLKTLIHKVNQTLEHIDHQHKNTKDIELPIIELV